MRILFEPAVYVNGQVISSQLIAAEAQNHPAPPGKPAVARHAAARALAVRALLLQEAERLGLQAAPNDLAPGKRETDEEALIRAAIEHHVRPEVPDEAACRDAYAAHPERFRAPNLYEAAHILLLAAPDALSARAAARELAAAFIREIAQAPRAFERLARENSACDSSANGGRLGQIAAGDTVPEFEAALDALSEGEVSPEPVETRYGLHVVRLDARADGAILPFENVRGRIEDAIERAAWIKGARALVQRLFDDAEISGMDLPAHSPSPPEREDKRTH